MFSEFIRKKIAKFMAIVMLVSNISPAIAIHHIVNPEYNVRIEKRDILNPVTGAIVQGFLVEAGKLIEEQAVQTYQTIFSQVVAPFMVSTAAIQSSVTATTAALYEILQKVQAETQQSTPLKDTDTRDELSRETSNPEGATQSSATDMVETELSRGFCLSIPELGDLLISHDGDVVFGTSAGIQKSLRIVAPSQVILNNATAKHIDVEATAAFLMGKGDATIDFLISALLRLLSYI